MSDDKRLFDSRQEAMYCMSSFLYYRWYRKLFGGKWRLLKLGKDTPYIYMFSTWTKREDDYFEGYVETIEVEIYPETGVDTKWKLYKKFFRNMFSLGK